MEMIGKGKHEKGAVWVAVKVPEGYVGSTANQARIRQFAHNDPDTYYAKVQPRFQYRCTVRLEALTALAPEPAP
jgi:dipeptidase